MNSGFFSVALSKITGKLSKTLSKKIPVFKRLSGINSYDASFKMVITKLKQGSIKKFHYKTIRKRQFQTFRNQQKTRLLSSLYRYVSAVGT